MLFVLGVVLGALGSSQYGRAQVEILGSRWPLGAIGIAVGVGAVCWCAGYAMQTRSGSGILGAGWLAASLTASIPRPEGDLLVTGTAAGYAYLFAGLVLVAAATVAHPDRRSRL